MTPPNEHVRDSPAAATRTYRFTLYPAGNPELTDELLDRLFEAGCDDASPGVRCGVTDIPFDREAASLDEAIRSAVRQVRSVGLEIERVELDRDDSAPLLAAGAAAPAGPAPVAAAA